MNILEAIDNPLVFGKLVQHDTYGAWRAFLASMFGLPLSEAELEIYQACTGRKTAPTRPFKEAMLPTGRRAGKSFTLSLIATYLGCFYDYRQFLAPGERATIMIMAADRKQARVIFRYCLGLIEGSPVLAKRLENQTREQINLQNSVTIEVATASHKTTRGYTIVAALLDELAFYGTTEEAASSDVEILNALRPGMGLIPNSMLLGASSPYARRGALWTAFRRYHGQDDAPVLVWQAGTKMMNPTFPQSIIDDALAEDASLAGAEYLGLFRSDIESFVAREVIDAAVQPGRHELPPMSGTPHFAFVDPSGGSADAMTMAVCHLDKDRRAILDAVRSRKPPFSPEAVVQDFADLLKTYGITKIVGDRYAGEWPRERFKVHGIDYQPSEKVKSDIYRDTLPLLNGGKVELLDLPKLTAEVCGLERRTARGGKDSIDHAPGAHDDLANSVCGAILLANSKPPPMVINRAALDKFSEMTEFGRPSRFSGGW